MSYIITDGQNYLVDHTGKGLTTVKRKAHPWKNTNAACNTLHLLQNSKRGSQFKDFYVLEDGDILDAGKGIPKIVTLPGDNTIVPDSIKQGYEELRDLCSHLDEYEQKVTDLTYERQDLLHMAEMENLNVCEGFKLYKRIQKVSQERREYKNKIKLIQALEHASMKDLISGNLLMQAKDIDDQLYKPRILKEEFKGKKWCK